MGFTPPWEKTAGVFPCGFSLNAFGWLQAFGMWPAQGEAMVKPHLTLPRLRAVAAVLASIVPAVAFANLIPISPVPTNVLFSTGSGLGAVNTLVTFQNTGTEVGAVGVTAGGAVVTGSSVAYFGGTTPMAGPTNEITGAGNNVYTLSQLGTNSFSNVVLLFNGSEPQAPADASITLTNLALNLYNPTTGALLGSFTTVGSSTYEAFPGVGAAGFAYQLDAAQASIANGLFAANPNLVIGGAAKATNAAGGLETLFISSRQAPATNVPDAGATVSLLGLALIGLAGLRRFVRQN